MAKPRRSRTLPPASPDGTGVGVLVVLACLLALTIAFVGTGGSLVDTIAAIGARPSGEVLGARSSGGPDASAVAAPGAGALGSIAPSPTASAGASASPSPAPSATAPPPVRKATTVNLLAGRDPRAIFVSEATDVLCAAAAVQMTVELLTGKVDRSKATQRRIHDLEVELTTRADSRNGGTGPLGMAATISRLGHVRYELRIASTRTAALRDAAATLARTHRPIVLLAWRGAHAWVMTGFRANADPSVFRDAAITGTYILDPWYPRVSRIWGPSDPPNTFQDAKEMVRNYLRWKRPEGHYPGRDGRFLYLAPVESTAG